MKTKNAYPSLAGVKPGNQLRSQRLCQGLAELGFRLEFKSDAREYSISPEKGGAIATGLSLDQVEDFWSLGLRAAEAHSIEPASKPRNRKSVVAALMENYKSNRAGILRALRRLEDGPTAAETGAVVTKSAGARDPKPKTSKLGVPPYQGVPMPPVRDPRSKLDFPHP